MFWNGCHCWLAQQCEGFKDFCNQMADYRKRVRHFDEAGHVHELTFSCYGRMPLLSSDEIRRIFCVSLDRAIKRHRYRLFAFVLMPEHIHLLVQPQGDGSSISDLLRAIKRPCSYRMKQWLAEHDPELLATLTIHQRPGITCFRFWQEGPGYDRNLTDANTIEAAIDYIHLNPVRRGLCARAIEWKWSSAKSYLLDNPSVDPDLPQVMSLPPDVLQ